MRVFSPPEKFNGNPGSAVFAECFDAIRTLASDLGEHRLTVLPPTLSDADLYDYIAEVAAQMSANVSRYGDPQNPEGRPGF